MIPRWAAIVGTIVLVIIAIILFTRSDSPTLQFPSSSNTPQVKGAQAAAVPIVFANGAFAPVGVNITAGQEVVFQNASAQPIRIASNPYPYDDDLPGLNATQATPPGGSYSYVFPRAGTFGYHNELDPAEGGTVTVGQAQ